LEVREEDYKDLIDLEKKKENCASIDENIVSEPARHGRRLEETKKRPASTVSVAGCCKSKISTHQTECTPNARF